MNRRKAEAMHQYTNIAYWLENPDWKPEALALRVASGVARALPIDIHETLKNRFFSPDVFAVNGESVVADSKTNPGHVDKFMFRFPKDMSLGMFEAGVREESRD